MQILPNAHDFDRPAFIKADGGEPEIPKNAPFASLMENISEKAAQRAHATAPTQQLEKARQATQRESGEQGLGQGVKVSREDFAALREKLAAQGLSDEDIKALENKLVSDEGLTWKEMLQFVADKLGFALNALSPEITGAMRNELSALFQKMGFDAEKSEELIKNLEDGKQARVWHVLSKRANQLGAEDLQQITRSELKTLATALGLPQDAMKRLGGMLAGDPDGTLPAKGARMTLDVIFNESAKVQKQVEEKLGELRGLIESGLEQARKVKDLKALADNRESKDVASAKVMIEDEAKKTYREDGAKAENGKHAAATGKGKEAGLEEGQAADAAKKQELADKIGQKAVDGEAAGKGEKSADGEAIGKADAKNAKGKQDAMAGLAASAGKNASNEAAAQAKADGQAKADAQARADGQAKADQALNQDTNGKNSADGDEKGQQDPDRKAFNDMWQRVASSGKNGETAMQQAERIVNQNFSMSPDKAAEAPLGEKVPPQNIARTVKDGIMQNLQQGGKQLTLRLDPPSLGKLTVILQVHNNEVRATIRTENVEATRLVNDQVNLLRHNLEQQGLKVEKLDVQTQADNNQHRSWNGAEEHNMSQERNRDSLRSAMRALKNKSEGDETLAREMQNDGTEATISQQGIHLIA